MSVRAVPRARPGAPDLCPVCGQRGTIAADNDGYVLVEHPGRAYACRPRPETPGEWLRVQFGALLASIGPEGSR